MENATKALIIAGSILIAVALIAMGVRVVKAPSNTADQLEGTMQTTEMAQFNSKFTAYVGTNKSRAQVMSLLNVIIANNHKVNAHKVQVNGCETTSSSNPEDITLSSKMNSLGNGPFEIEIGLYDNNGYVKNISITYKLSGRDTAI